MADKENIKDVPAEEERKTVPIEDYNRLVADYQKLSRAFNRLFDRYNRYVIDELLNKEDK